MSKSDADQVEMLAARLLDVQSGMDLAEAKAIASRIAADPQILMLAIEWSQAGAWPNQPVIEGWTPADLGRLYRPSFVLTALLWLKEDPEGAKQSLRHAFVDGDSSCYKSRVTTDPLRAGFFTSPRRREENPE